MPKKNACRLTLISLLAGLLLAVLAPLSGFKLDGPHHAFDASPLEATVLSQLSEAGADVHAHAHAHDDGPGEDARTGHAHGHSAVDHVHDNLMLPPDGARTPVGAAADWVHRHGFALATAPPTTLERPPKPMPV